MSDIKGIAKYLDLYSTSVLIEALKKDFNCVSYTLNAKTIPTCGSIVKDTAKIKTDFDFKVDKVIFHKNGRITIKTNNKQYFQFLNL